MDFELDKHDIFRNVVPGAIFFLTIASFLLANKIFSINAFKDAGPLTILLGIAITLPIGYLIHNVYRCFHITCQAELHAWYRVENALLRNVLKEKSPHVNLEDAEHGSWFIEVCLHEGGSVLIRERLYTLISRVHSAGSAIAAILLAMFLSVFILHFTNHQVITVINALLFVAWALISLSLCISRKQSIKSFQILIDHFLKIRHKLFIATAACERDPFEITDERA